MSIYFLKARSANVKRTETMAIITPYLAAFTLCGEVYSSAADTASAPTVIMDRIMSYLSLRACIKNKLKYY